MSKADFFYRPWAGNENVIQMQDSEPGPFAENINKKL